MPLVGTMKDNPEVMEEGVDDEHVYDSKPRGPRCDPVDEPPKRSRMAIPANEQELAEAVREALTTFWIRGFGHCHPPTFQGMEEPVIMTEGDLRREEDVTAMDALDGDERFPDEDCLPSEAATGIKEEKATGSPARTNKCDGPGGVLSRPTLVNNVLLVFRLVLDLRSRILTFPSSRAIDEKR